MTVVLLACGGNIFRPEFLTRSPDGRRELIIARDQPDRDSGYRYWIEVREDGKPRILKRVDEPTSIGLVESNWTADSGIVRVFFCEGSTPSAFGFDFIKLRTLSPREILPVLVPQIQHRYGLQRGIDVANWACGAEGRAAYRIARR